MITAHQAKKRGGNRESTCKKFRIMIAKMIQNLENKMELQINRLETKVEKNARNIQQGPRRSKTESINNENDAISEIKSTLRGPTVEKLSQKLG